MSVLFNNTTTNDLKGTTGVSFPSTTFTVCCWVLANNAVNTGTAFELSSGGLASGSIDIETTPGNLEVDVSASTLFTIASDSGGNRQNQWAFIALTKSGTTITGYSSAYGGGVLTSASSTSSAVTATITQVTVGNYGSGTNPWNGNIENFMLWSGVALTGDQLFNQQWKKRPIETGGLYLWYPLLSNYDIRSDASGHGRNLTLGSAANLNDQGAPNGWS